MTYAVLTLATAVLLHAVLPDASETVRVGVLIAGLILLIATATLALAA